MGKPSLPESFDDKIAKLGNADVNFSDLLIKGKIMLA
jgi:hypothetical protein